METATKSVAQCLDESVKTMDDFNPDEPEMIGSPSVGDVVRHGDVYLVCLDSMPKGTPTQNMQLAPGNTQGSRHILADPNDNNKPANVNIVNGWDWHSIDCLKEFTLHHALIGPAFECKSATEVTHPEHQHKILPEGTVWGTIYQRQHAEEVRRVMD